MLDPGKFRKISAATGDSREARNFSDRRIRIRRGGQLRAQHQLRNSHRLVDKNLLLIFAGLTRLQNGFDRNDRRFEFERALQEQGCLER